MGLFDGILGGIVGAGMTAVVNGLIEQNGGIAGIVSKFEQGGLGDTVRSWVGTGQNLPISADQIHQILGSDAVTGIAQKLGISTEELNNKLAELLPQAVDQATPNDRMIVDEQDTDRLIGHQVFQHRY